ncbi:uncharacterized protein LOC117102350 [Anneissia japonica]|uniref:uncharacterized protein LOC117102350 n=1 Tax=Anneissia japonica TaxID=1529436 RepID=UPI00142574B6|nr:uncharacterized protein LOC117102350 [Anneissia japonica]
MVNCDDCSSRVPYGSMFATVLLCTGIGFFTGASLVGISETEEMFDQTSIKEDMDTLYFMMLVWLFITCSFVIPTIFMKMTTEYCYSDGIINESNDEVSPGACLNLTWYGIGEPGSTVCDEALLVYCQQSEKAYVFSLVSFLAACLATLGMVNFLMCLAANSSHLRDGLKRQDYEMKRNMEEQELFHLTMNKSTERLATTPYF